MPGQDGGAGDSIYYAADCVHAFANTGAEPCVYYLVVAVGAGTVFVPMPEAAWRALMDAPFPDSGTAPDTILDAFRDTILPYPMGNGHPRFFGWVNSPPAPMGVIADLLAAAMNPSCAGSDHAAIYLERAVVRWIMDLVGFPAPGEEAGAGGSMGLLVSGGSMASLTCLAAARVGLSPQAISKLEQPQYNLTLGTLQRYLNALGYSVEVAVKEPDTGEVVERVILAPTDGAMSA